MIRVAVFDFDGTLVDSNAIKHRTFDEVVAGLPDGAGALAEARKAGGDRYQIFRKISESVERDAAKGNDLAHSLAVQYSRRCLDAIKAAPERRGASCALHYLRRRGIRLYINTATPKVDIVPILRARGWADLFVDALGAPAGKIENLARILRKERLSSRSVIMVGDSADDMDAAAALGMRFVGITCESRIVLRKPFGMSDLRKLPPLVASLNGYRPLYPA